MENSFREALTKALKLTGKSLRAVAAEAGVSYDQYKGFLQGKSKSTNVDDAVKVAHSFGVSMEDFLAGNLVETADNTIAIAGKVGAGAHVPVFDVYEKGDGPQVECPPGLSPQGIVAVEIQGDSMEPLYSEGDFLFYTRDTHDGVPDDAIGKRCVCEDADGNGWVKLIKRGTEPGLYHLIALNPDAENQHDVTLNWAAQVRLHWPSELANTYDR